MNRQVVEAQNLKVGQKLCSGGLVTHAPSRGIKTPTGKIDIGIDGYLKTWSKKTGVAIIAI